MTTLEARPGAPTPVLPVTFPRVVTSEWIKFRTVRATVWTLSMTVLAMVGIAALAAWSIADLLEGSGEAMGPGDAAAQAASFPIAGWFIAQLVVAVLGVLVITGEYGTGMIRSTFAAVPQRVPALLGKALVLFGVVAVVSAVAVALSWLVALPFLGRLDLAVDLTDATSLRLLLGAPLYLATIAVLAFAIGALVRHSAGALAVVLGLLLVVETVFASLPLRFFETVSPYLPSTAGQRLLAAGDESTFGGGADAAAVLTPWQGYAVLVAWVVVLTTAAAVLVRRRDA